MTVAFNKDIYGSLLLDVLPASIDSDEEYARIEEIFNKMFHKELSPEEGKLFNLLADLMEASDKEFTDSVLIKSTPRETLAYLMKENGLKQADLADVFGTQSVVSEVISGKREITKSQAKALAERFAMKIEAFI
jgi:HTH-type transcriptional regulator / antitoxin HigA